MSSAATGPPCRGSSRVKVTGRWVGTGSPTTTTSAASTTASRAQVEQGPPVDLDRGLVGAVQPGGHPAREHDRRERPRPGPLNPALRAARDTGGVSTLSVTVVQEASGLDPAVNRARLHELVPDRQRPRGAARGVRPRLRRGRLRRQRVRRAAGRRVRRPSWPRWPRSTTPPWWPGCSRPPRTRPGPTTRCWCAARSPRRTARSTSTTPSATASPTGCAPATRPGAVRRRRLPGRA